MANLAILRAALNAAIYQNYDHEISGSTLNAILNSMVDAIGGGYQFRGVATPETNPGTPDPNVFYIAAQVGTYSNFGLSVGENEVALFLWDGIWRKQNTGAASAEVVSQLGQKVNGYYNYYSVVGSGANATILCSDIDKIPGDRIDFRYDGVISELVIYSRTSGGLNTQLSITDDGNGEGHFTLLPQSDLIVGFTIISLPSSKTFSVKTSYVNGLDSKVQENTQDISVLQNENVGLRNLLDSRSLGKEYCNIILNSCCDNDTGQIIPFSGRSRSEKLPYNGYANYEGTQPYFCCFYNNDTFLGATYTGSVISPYSNTTHLIMCYNSLVSNIKYSLSFNKLDASTFSHCKDVRWNPLIKEIYITNDSYDEYSVIINPSPAYSVVLYGGASHTYIAAESLYNIMPNGLLRIGDHAIVMVDVDRIADYTNLGGYYIGLCNYNLVCNPFINAFLHPVSPSDVYTKQQVDTLLDEKADNTDLVNFYTKEETYSKSQTDALLEEKADAQTIESINEALSDLSGQLPPGAITGDNVWTGANQFAQAIIGVEGNNQNNVALLSQLHNGSKAHREINALDYGFHPNKTAAENTLALQNAVSGGNKTIKISLAGTYLLNDTIELESFTTISCSKGVILKKASAYGFVFINKGASDRVFNNDILLDGIYIDADEKDGAPDYNDIDNSLWGMRGQISFLCANRVKLTNITIVGLGISMYGVMANNVDHIVLDTFYIYGRKDGVHYSKVSNFAIRNGIIKTSDDNIALNAADWISSNCLCGDIVNGVIENIHSLNNRDESWGQGINLVRCLTGAWKDWEQGMSLMRGDFVVNNGNIYRMVVVATGTTAYTSQTEPTISTYSGKQSDAGGFYWKLMSKEVYYKCEIKDVVVRNCKMDGQDNMVTSGCDTGTSGYSRTLYPSVVYADYPICDVSFERIVLNPNINALSLGGNQKTRMVLRGIKFYKQTEVPTFSDDSLGGKVIFDDCDFDNVPDNAKDINCGSKGTLILNNCRKTQVSGAFSSNGYLNINCYGRLICDFFTNVAVTLSELTPRAGDYVRRLNVPNIYKNGSWVEL